MQRKLNKGMVGGGKNAFIGAVHRMAANFDRHIQFVCVAFSSLISNLTSSGFYTSTIGIADIGYKGNTQNQWNGVPDEVLKQYNIAYTEKKLKECVSFDKPI